jgi:hypothetical protein
MRKRLVLSLLVLWFLAPSLVRAETLNQLETQVRLLLRDSSSDVSFQRFSIATIDGFINEGQRQLQNDAWLYEGYYSMGLNQGQQEYPLPSDFISIIRVTISSSAITQVSFYGLDGSGSNQSYGGSNVNWTIATSTPTEFFIDEFVSSAPVNIGFYPVPNATTTNSVLIQYVRQVPTLVNESDVPFNNNAEYFPYHDAIADFAAAKCWYILDRIDMYTTLMGMYTARAAQARANINKMPAFTPGAAGNRGPRQ